MNEPLKHEHFFVMHSDKRDSRVGTWTGIAVVLALILTLILFSLSARAQAQTATISATALPMDSQPETLPMPDLWLKPGPSVQHVVGMQAAQRIPAPLYAANYALPNQVALRADLARLYTPGSAQTIALVLVPNFETPKAEAYLHIGNVAVYDDHSRNGYANETHDFRKDEPVMLVFRTNPVAGYGKTAGGPVQFVDTNLFDVAEVCVYNQLLSNDQTRHLETYLALKYSINISRNKEARYRNYFTAEQTTQWYSPTEGRYNQQILGLGRLDDFGWYQTQTASNEKLPFTLALEQVLPQGEMPEATLANNSYLIASKANSYATENCPAPVSNLPFYGWKIKRTAWQSSAKYLHLTARLMPGAAATSSDTVLLTDGTHNYLLYVQKSRTQAQLSIPLALLQDDINYFLLPVARKALCEENIRVAVDSVNNTIGLYVNPEMLPLTADLLGLSNQSTAHYPLTDPFAVINTASSGQYQLNLYDTQGNLAYSTLANLYGNTGAAAGMNSYTAGNLNQLQNNLLKDELIALAEGTRLLAYPNPAAENTEVTFQLLNPVAGNYAVRVVDQGGRLLHHTHLEVTPENASWGYRFSTPGAYTVVFTHNQLTLSQTVIIK